jgi:hypothetical protein
MLVEVIHSANIRSTYLFGILAFLTKFPVIQESRQLAHCGIQYRFSFHVFYSRILHVRIWFRKRRQVLFHPLCGTMLHSILPIGMLMCL